eukprot:757406-Hanusia_phi.AAC.1
MAEEASGEKVCAVPTSCARRVPSSRCSESSSTADRDSQVEELELGERALRAGSSPKCTRPENRDAPRRPRDECSLV